MTNEETVYIRVGEHEATFSEGLGPDGEYDDLVDKECARRMAGIFSDTKNERAEVLFGMALDMIGFWEDEFWEDEE